MRSGPLRTLADTLSRSAEDTLDMTASKDDFRTKRPPVFRTEATRAIRCGPLEDQASSRADPRADSVLRDRSVSVAIERMVCPSASILLMMACRCGSALRSGRGGPAARAEPAPPDPDGPDDREVRLACTGGAGQRLSPGRFTEVVPRCQRSATWIASGAQRAPRHRTRRGPGRSAPRRGRPSAMRRRSPPTVRRGFRLGGGPQRRPAPCRRSGRRGGELIDAQHPWCLGRHRVGQGADQSDQRGPADLGG